MESDERAFPATAAWLASDRGRPGALFLGGGTLLLLLLGAWLVTARVTLRERVSGARIEVDLADHPVDAPLEGRVAAIAVELGATVAAGDALVRLDDERARLARAAAQARADDLLARGEAAAREIAAERAAADALPMAQAAREAEAREQAAAARIELAELELAATTREELAADGTLTRDEARAARSRAAVAAARLRALDLALARIAPEIEVERRDRLARVAELEADAVELAGAAQAARAELLVHEQALAQHVVRAPIAGRVARLSDRRVGSVVAAGTPLLVLVPSGTPRVVAEVDARLAGRMRVGQRARLEFERFPWTRFGFRHATVAALGNAGRDGTMTALLDLDLAGDAQSPIPLEHGARCDLEIDVEVVAPLDLLARSVGRLLEPAR